MSPGRVSAPVAALLEDTWTQGGALRWVLAPAASLFGAALLARRAAFALRLRRAEKLGVPVLSIGNLTVGGTGKTPAALWLAERLRGAGFRPAIVTRGYGGALEGRTLSVGTSGRGEGEIELVGDEAVLLAERFSGPVVCGVDRVAAARVAVESHGAEMVILDDGFQHWRLARHLDIVLVDGRVGFGNGALLPAGPLREPLSALGRADIVVITKGAASEGARARIARHAPGAPVLSGELVPRSLSAWDDGRILERSLGELVGKRVVTVSGIARPQPFYDLLGELAVRPVEVLEYPDHHVYSQSDWQRITLAARRAELVVCTEKDWVKLRRFPFARGGLVALRVDFVLAPADEEILLAKVLERAGLRSAEDTEWRR